MWLLKNSIKIDDSTILTPGTYRITLWQNGYLLELQGTYLHLGGKIGRPNSLGPGTTTIYFLVVFLMEITHIESALEMGGYSAESGSISSLKNTNVSSISHICSLIWIKND